MTLFLVTADAVMTRRPCACSPPTPLHTLIYILESSHIRRSTFPARRRVLKIRRRIRRARCQTARTPGRCLTRPKEAGASDQLLARTTRTGQRRTSGNAGVLVVLARDDGGTNPWVKNARADVGPGWKLFEQYYNALLFFDEGVSLKLIPPP